MSAPVFLLAGKELPLKWSLRAQYRMQTLPAPSSFADLMRADRALAASINFGWAMLPKAATIATPEAFADAIEAEEDGKGVERLDEALAAAIAAAFPSGDAAEAKKASTGSSPAPASSSG